MDKTDARLVDTGSDHRAVIVDYDVPAPIPRAEPVKEPAVKFVTRAQWGGPAQRATPSSHPIGNPQGVSLHWTGPGVGTHSHDRCASKVYAIWRYHTGGNGWADIAYNLLVCRHGYVFEGRGANVASAANGYKAANQSHYAICYLGGEGDPFTDEAKQAFRDGVAYLRDKGGAGPEVNGHRDHKSTACPGDEIYRWLKTETFSDTTTTEDDDMALDDKLWPNDPDSPAVRDVLRSLHNFRLRTDARLKELVGRDGDELADAIAERLSTEVPAAKVKAAVKEALREGVE